MTDARLRRLAAQEGALRDVNDSLRQHLEQLQTLPPTVAFVCECSRPDCDATVQLPPAQYDAVRDHPARFLLAPGHELEELEIVVAADAGHLVVEKIVPVPADGVDAGAP